MLQALKELGEEKMRQEGETPENAIENMLNTIVQDPNESGNYPCVLIIVFRRIENRFVYDRIQVEQTSKVKIPRYLYRRGSPKGPDRTPVSRVTEISKTFQEKIEGWFEKFGQRNPFFAELEKALYSSKDDILHDLQKEWAQVSSSLKRQQSGVLTIGVEEDEELRYPGDFNEFRDLLEEEILAKYRNISKENHVCAICGEKKSEVYGGALSEVFKFYNLDKPGYIAGGFKRKDAWRNFPICLDCILKIEEGRNFATQHLAFRMGGQRYWLIPKLLRGVPEVRSVITMFFQIAERSGEILKEQALERRSKDERDILDELGKLPDALTYNFFFFQTQKASSIPREITLLVEDVLPSRLSKIFEAKKRVDTCDLLHNVKIKKDEYADIKFRFDGFRRFTPSNKAFLEVIDRVFRGLPIDRNLVMSWIMSRVKLDFSGDRYLKPLVLKGLSALLFFSELKLFEQSNQRVKGGKLMTELSPLAESFFGRHTETFPGPVSKALFLLGVLTQKLLNIQLNDRGSTPFRRNLKGLKMKEEDFKGLISRIQNKLEEYNKNYYRNLEALISDYFLQAGRGWDMPTDEMNFYFVLGMNLQEEVTKALGLKKE